MFLKPLHTKPSGCQELYTIYMTYETVSMGFDALCKPFKEPIFVHVHRVRF